MNIIKTDKFHTIGMVKRYIMPFKKENVTILTLLAIYLSLSNNKYKTSQEYSKFLDANYGMNPNVKVIVHGDYHILSFSMVAINPKWIKDEEYTIDLIKDTFKLSYENPNIVRQSFSKKMVDMAKNELLAAIANYNFDKSYLATKNALSNYLNLDFSVLFGDCNKEEVLNITPKKLYNFYNEVIKYPSVFYADGEIDDELDDLVMPKYQITRYATKFDEHNSLENKVDEYDGKETNIRIILDNAPKYKNSKDALIMLVANHLFGGASNSRLFINVREKHSLCYSIYSNYYSLYGIILISLGCAEENVEKAIMQIDEEIDKICKLEFSDEELEISKNKLINNLKANMDARNFNIEENFITDTFLDKGLFTIDKIDIIKTVTKEDIKKVFTKLKKTYTYVMKGTGNEIR